MVEKEEPLATSIYIVLGWLVGEAHFKELISSQL